MGKLELFNIFLWKFVLIENMPIFATYFPIEIISGENYYK
jgi:hypothetical protein